VTSARRPVREVVLALVLALSVLGCSAESSPRSAVTDPVERALEASGLPGSLDYVALGDSFTAGPFIGTMRVDPEGCARSHQNYPAFLADWLDVASYTDVSCSAATTDSLTRDQPLLLSGGVAGPQLAAVTEGTDLVTLGIGGNDFGIYSSLLACQAPGAVCPVAQLRSDAGRVAGRVRQAVVQVGRRAPEADVYVVGYPDILPPRGSCPEVGVGARVLRPLTGIARRLNRSIRRGAEAAGATYVDVGSASRGHDVCAGPEAWVNGKEFRAGLAAPFHPLAAGMRGMAAVVFRSIAGIDPPDGERAEPDPDAVVRNQVS
jgi:lysophospholipase L1-like esterase